MITRTPSFLLLVQSVDQIFPYIRPEVGRVQRDNFGFFFEEEHGARLRSDANRVKRRGGYCGRKRDNWSASHSGLLDKSSFQIAGAERNDVG